MSTKNRLPLTVFRLRRMISGDRKWAFVISLIVVFSNIMETIFFFFWCRYSILITLISVLFLVDASDSSRFDEVKQVVIFIQFSNQRSCAFYLKCHLWKITLLVYFWTSVIGLCVFFHFFSLGYDFFRGRFIGSRCRKTLLGYLVIFCMFGGGGQAYLQVFQTSSLRPESIYTVLRWLASVV